MIDLLLNRFRRVHMIGIGGSGMSGIAEILLRNGFEVSGCDLSANESTELLREVGATIYEGHDVDHVEHADVVIYSSAVDQDHQEILAAQKTNTPVIRRAEMLAELMRMKVGVAISGTHGKTTTTSLVGDVLTAGGLSPTVIVGGRLKRIGTGAIHGQSEFLVAEADEYDQSFLRLTPTLAVITNIDEDHLECYGSFEALENAFVQFANSVPFYGRTVVCIDEPSIIKILPRISRNVISYGFSPQADVRAEDAEYDGMESSFSLVHSDDSGKSRITLPLPGRHNILNALAAAAVGLELGLSHDQIETALKGFAGVHRRFEIVGEKNGILVVDDFGHHPTEIAATLEAARRGWNKRIVAVFQPHLYSRTRDMAEGFATSLLGADRAIVLPIYPAREKPIKGVSAELIVEAAEKMGHKGIRYLPDKSEIANVVKEIVQPDDLVIVIGAGDVYKLGPQILNALDE